MKKTFKLTCLLNGKTYIWRIEARDFISAVSVFNTSSQFEGYELFGIELDKLPKRW